jgi:hypothetical protein
VGEIMKGAVVVTFAAILPMGLAGCASGSAPRPAATVTVTVTPGAASSPTADAGIPASATVNERLLVNGLNATIAAVPARAVAGPLMRAYALFERAYSSASGAVGQPDSTGTVTQIAAGYKLCYPATSSSAVSCEAFAHFTTNQAGQVTDMTVIGQPVAGRISTARAAASGGLAISSVVAYRLTREDIVVVAFKLTDSSYRPQNTSPSLLASLNGASDVVGQDALPAYLAPGDSLYAAAAFDITQNTGMFCLLPNDGFGEHLPCTTLKKV